MATISCRKAEELAATCKAEYRVFQEDEATMGTRCHQRERSERKGLPRTLSIVSTKVPALHESCND